MLRTNSKKASSNIREYILKNFDATGYDVELNTDDFSEVAKFILNTVHEEKSYLNGSGVIQFEEWSTGLPSLLDTCYHYNRSAVADLAKILEETDAEASRYKEQDAEKVLDILIYRELVRGAKR